MPFMRDEVGPRTAIPRRTRVAPAANDRADFATANDAVAQDGPSVRRTPPGSVSESPSAIGRRVKGLV